MNMSLTAGSNTKRLIFHPPHSAVANQIEKSICSRFRAKLYQHFYTPRFVFASFDAPYPFIFVSVSIHCNPGSRPFFLIKAKKKHTVPSDFSYHRPPRPLPQRTLRIFLLARPCATFPPGSSSWQNDPSIRQSSPLTSTIFFCLSFNWIHGTLFLTIDLLAAADKKCVYISSCAVQDTSGLVQMPLLVTRPLA